MLAIIQCRICCPPVCYTKNIKLKIYRTIIVPIVLHGCETRSLILREEHGLRLFENRVLRKIFGTKRKEATGEWRRLRSEELCDLNSSPNITRVIKLARIIRAGMWNVWEAGQIPAGSWWETGGRGTTSKTAA
jgi:hypothetical protein